MWLGYKESKHWYIHSVPWCFAVVEPALEGDKSGSSATDEKTGSEYEEKEASTETEGEEGEDSDEAPGEPEEAKVGIPIDNWSWRIPHLSGPISKLPSWLHP
jgi:hypothetical protein